MVLNVETVVEDVCKVSVVVYSSTGGHSGSVLLLHRGKFLGGLYVIDAVLPGKINILNNRFYD